MAGQPGDSRLEREAASPAPEASGLCAELRKPPPLSLASGAVGPPSGKEQFSYSVCSQIGVIPWSQISG